MNELRLNKYISLCGVASRRGADELIKEGKVKINGKVVTEPGVSVTKKDVVTVEGKQIKEQHKKYVLFYKPAGYITTVKDPEGRKTIYDLLPEEFQSLKTAGRLDKDSTGLILLTNDGDLIQQFTHPKVHIPKIYRVAVQGKINDNHIMQLQKGLEIEPGKIAQAFVVPLEYRSGESALQVTLFQGYNRQIRRMMDMIDMPVVSLKRTAHGCLQLGNLKRGEHKILQKKEVDEIFKYLKGKERNAKKFSK
ncbi:MAG: pseudouridine synthase [bacterium]